MNIYYLILQKKIDVFKTGLFASLYTFILKGIIYGIH